MAETDMAENCPPRRLEGPARRAEILMIAREEFLERGYAGTSLGSIIARAGGSRRTIYEQFGSKAGLFQAIIADVRDRMAKPFAPGDDPEAALLALGRSYMGQLMAADNLCLYRTVMGEVARFPEMGAGLFRTGPEGLADQLAAALAGWTGRGLLRLDDPALAARQFLEMVKGDLHLRALLDPSRMPEEAEIDACVRGAVRLFLEGALARG
ncbi:MAG TPA: TetR/AcrR family transcriptional regulator [Azospirillaceae bacterium]|nr:TetR/AcrR family transcriptional regulator [Azospirillaceae bacterium]